MDEDEGDGLFSFHQQLRESVSISSTREEEIQKEEEETVLVFTAF